MTNTNAIADPRDAVQSINDAWLAGKIDQLRELFHPDILMAFPGFNGISEGADAMIAGFEDFARHGKVEELDSAAWHVHEAGNSAVVTYTYSMVYQRDGGRYQSTGRDLWVLTRLEGSWKAVWRTMLDVAEFELRS